MRRTSQRKPLFERLKSALEDGIQFAQGTIRLRTSQLPSRPPEFTARRIIGLRHRLRLSQEVFARTLNVSPKTVQSWEQGGRSPSRAALRLLQLLEEKPELVCEVICTASHTE